MIKLTNGALDHLKKLKDKHNVKFIRLEVKGGGCAGFEYKWSFENSKEEHDIVVDDILIIDDMYEIYLVGMVLDYKEEIFGSNFVFDNPNSKSSCGCGTSFSI
jgi:iron-sulfur cluster insertion protein|tara:strand:+ start:736 stop:1044 length:309 start_codon:yes stop_codon:yes gene_type:complete